MRFLVIQLLCCLLLLAASLLAMKEKRQRVNLEIPIPCLKHVELTDVELDDLGNIKTSKGANIRYAPPSCAIIHITKE